MIKVTAKEYINREKAQNIKTAPVEKHEMNPIMSLNSQQ